MTTAKRFTSLLAFSLFALVINLQAQTPADQVPNGQDAAVQRKAAAEADEPPTPLAVGPIDGEGTPGKISKFTGANAIGDSIMTEKPGKIGLNTTAPTAALHVNGLQPAAVATNGTTAPLLLQTTGGKGGNTIGAGKSGGKGASISLVAGDGGNAPADGLAGAGGDIILKPGLMGAGGLAAEAPAGFVLIAPDTVGRVAIGTNVPFDNSRLTVASGNDPIALSAVGNNVGVLGSSNGGDGVRGFSSTKDGVYGQSFSGIGVFGRGYDSSTGVQGLSSTGVGIYGQSTSNAGIFGFSSTGDGVTGGSGSGYAGNFNGKGKFTGNFEIGKSEFFLGTTFRQMINLLHTTHGIGVQTATFYFRTGGGFNWYRGGGHNDAKDNAGGGVSLMRLDSNGNLFTNGAVNPPSDRNLKANFAAVNPRLILDKLASVPIQTWNYKTDSGAVRHIGPVSQDFRAAFDLGVDDKHISTVDADGVALAAIQGLYQMMLEKEKQNEQLARMVAEQGSRIEQLRAKLTQLERRSGRRAAGRPRRR